MVTRSRSIRYRSSPGGATLFTPDQFSFIQGELARISAALQGVDDYIQSGEITLAVYTNSTRPAAGTEGRIIFNSDDGNLNIDDGTDWILPDGTTT